MEITLAVILSYISNYLLSFVISLLGAFTSEMMTAMKQKTKLYIYRVLVPGFFDGFLLCALQECLKMDFALYALICFVLGMWGLQIIEMLGNSNFIFTFLKSFLKLSSSSLLKAAGEGLSELDKDKKKEDKENDTDKQTTSKDKSATP